MIARYFDEGEIKTGNTGRTALYYTHDHLGSVMETTQACGKVLGSLDYGPYGEPEKAQGQLPDFRYAGMLHHGPTCHWNQICAAKGSITLPPPRWLHRAYAFKVLKRSIKVIGCWGDSWKP